MDQSDCKYFSEVVITSWIKVSLIAPHLPPPPPPPPTPPKKKRKQKTKKFTLINGLKAISMSLNFLTGAQQILD